VPSCAESCKKRKRRRWRWREEEGKKRKMCKSDPPFGLLRKRDKMGPQKKTTYTPTVQLSLSLLLLSPASSPHAKTSLFSLLPIYSLSFFSYVYVYVCVCVFVWLTN
jgi:hypothetical protein